MQNPYETEIAVFSLGPDKAGAQAIGAIAHVTNNDGTNLRYNFGMMTPDEHQAGVVVRVGETGQPSIAHGHVPQHAHGDFEADPKAWIAAYLADR